MDEKHGSCLRACVFLDIGLLVVHDSSEWHVACRWLLRKSWNFLHMSWRTCKTLLILEFSLVPSYEDLVGYNQYWIVHQWMPNMCFLCISLILLVLLTIDQSLATALWICWHCNDGKIKFPVNNRLSDSQQAFDFHLKYLHGPKKLRIRMNEDYPSTCPHNSGSFAFMLNTVSGWSDSSEGYCTVCFSHAAALRSIISFVIHMLAMVRIIVY